MSEKEERALGDLEGFFLGLTSELFRDDEHWFASGQAHSLFTPALTMWLMMLQALHKGSLSDAVVFVEDGLADRILEKNTRSKKAKSKKFSTQTSAYSQARNRLEVSAIQEIVEELTKRAEGKKRGQKPEAVLIDGTMLTLVKSDDIERRYPAHRNDRGACLPQMRVVFSADVYSGAVTTPCFDSPKVSEQKLCSEVLGQLAEGTIVIADSNFGIFSVLAHCVRCKLEGVIRLTEARAKKILGHSVRKRSLGTVIFKTIKMI